MRAPGSYLRWGVLLALAALAHHGLRSWAELGGHAHGEVARSAHGYLSTLTLVVGVLAALAAAHLVARLAIGWRSADGTPYAGHGGRRVWLSATVVVLCVCLGQESVESLIATGDPAALADVLRHGGWTAIPFAILLGGAVAIGVRGADAAIVFLGRRRRAGVERGASGRRRSVLPAGHQRRPEPLADAAAGRAPPPVLAAP